MSNALFSTIPAPRVPRNTFKLSHSNKFTMTAQKLYPTLLMECLPGDRHLVNSEMFVRAMPMVAPVYQSYNISQHAFFVPMRTLSKNWEQFITGGREGTYSDVMPYTTLGDIYALISYLVDGDGSTEAVEMACECVRNFDFMGLPFKYQSSTDNSTFIGTWISLNSDFTDSPVPVNLLPFLAYLKIWSEYYRDENIVEDIYDTVVTALSLDTAVGLQSDLANNSPEYWGELFKMRPRAWKKDRFTSALPFTQRGPDVLLPIGGTAPVSTYIGTSSASAISNASVVASTSAGTAGDTRLATLDLSGVTNTGVSQEVDFADAELTTTINDLRRAERLQRWYENSARGGARLNENTLAHWGVHTPDATLDRAVFLGGTYQPLTISEVAQTSGTVEGSTPQGTLAGKGTSYNSDKLFKHYDSEHGYIIVLTSILQQGDYYQGIPQVFTRQDRYEYAWPELANLGEEPIYTRELYALAGNDTVFGYSPRYSSYKYMPNEIHGDMRTSLISWAVPRTFENAPQLSSEFIYADPSKAPFAVIDGNSDEFICVCNLGIKSSRLLPFYGVPSI